jgi:hypothetical protein
MKRIYRAAMQPILQLLHQTAVKKKLTGEMIGAKCFVQEHIRCNSG